MRSSLDARTLIAKRKRRKGTRILLKKNSTKYPGTFIYFNRGRASLDLNSEIFDRQDAVTKLTQKSSNLIADNDINIIAKDDIDILASNLSTINSSGLGEINLTSKNGNVNILSQSNTINTSTQIKQENLALSFGIGNAHVDTAYAVHDLKEAGDSVVEAKANLNAMETKFKNGEASKDAVDDAKVNLALATANLYLAKIKLNAAATKSAGSAESLWTGFYGDVRLNASTTRTNSNSQSIGNVASNVTSNNGDINIKSGLELSDTDEDLLKQLVGNSNIEGSNIRAINGGDINITSKANTNIKASKDTFASSSKTTSRNSSVTLASSNSGGAGAVIDNIVNAAAISLGAGMGRSKTDSNSTSYNNSNIIAQNGDIIINSLGALDVTSSTHIGGDTNVIGANILANNTTINSQGNLIVQSLQNYYKLKARSNSFNIGGTANANSGGVQGINVGVSNSRTDIERNWVDNQTTIIGTNAININTQNNSDVIGALIANITNAKEEDFVNQESNNKENWVDGNNLVLNSKTLTYQDIKDYYNEENTSLGFSTNIGGASATASNSNDQGSASNDNVNQQNNFYPTGSTTLALTNDAKEMEQLTRATIGGGKINIGETLTLTFDEFGNLTAKTGGEESSNKEEFANLNRDIKLAQEITKDQITGALDANVTIDNRLIASAFGSDGAWDSLDRESEGLGGKLKVTSRQLTRLADLPLVTLVTADIPYISEGASYLAAKNGGLVTLASQLFGLGTILGINDYRLINVSESNSPDLTAALKEESENPGTYKINLVEDKKLSEVYLSILDKKTGDEEFKVEFSLDSTDFDDIDFMNYLTSSDSSNHGINNNSSEAYRNGRMQLGNLQNINDETGQGSFVIGSAPSHGLIPDMLENLYNTAVNFLPFGNYFKSGNVIAGNEFRLLQSDIKSFPQVTLSQDQFSSLKDQNITPKVISQERDFYTVENPLKLLRFSDHSNGVDRDLYAYQSLYKPNTILGQIIKAAVPPVLANSLLKVVDGDSVKKAFSSGSYYDADSDKNIHFPGAFVQAYGGSTRSQKLGETADSVGVRMSRNQVGVDNNGVPIYSYAPGQIINPGDPVPNIMGLNATSLSDIGNSLVNVLYLGNPDKSPHGTYLCRGMFCGFDGFDQLQSFQQ